VEAVVHHALLAMAVAALASTALRLASLLTPRGLERAIAAAPIGVSLALIWALLLGLAELGTNTAALALSALATWLGVRALAPAPEVRLGAELREWWGALPRGARAGVGAVAALGVAYAGFVLRHPQLGVDAILYHLSDVVAWIENGRPGSTVDFVYGRPLGNLPQANETLHAWGTGLSRSFVFAGVWSVAAMGLLTAAGWLGLRTLGVSRRLAVLGLAAVCTAPVIVQEMRTPGTDLPALAWVVTAAALVAASGRRPALLAPALLAGALGIGTKPTVAPLALAVLVIGFAVHRRRLREHRRPLVLAALAASVVGGAWYVRNMIGHGAPLWPMTEFPGSDPRPPLFEAQAHSLLSRPEESLSGHLDEYEHLLAGYLVLIAAAVIAPFLARRREVTFAGIAAALSVIIYVNAPYTGAGDLESLARPFLTALRYLLPAAAAAGFCVVFAASRGKQPGRSFAEAALVLAVAWNVWRTLDLDYPLAPSTATLVLAAALGAFAAAVTPGRLLRWAPVAGLVAFVVVGAVATDGYAERHARAGSPRVPFSPVVGLLADRSDFEDGSERVSMAPGVSAMLAGDELEHEVVLIPSDEPCSKIEARARDGWVVIADIVADSVPAYTARQCFAGRAPLIETGDYRVYHD
jgi:hypothetical protein